MPVPSPLRRVQRPLGRAITTYRLIDDGDRILVALSGGKDSSVLLYVLRELQSRAPVRFDLAAVTVDAGWGGHPVEPLRRYCDALGVPLIVQPAAIIDAVMAKLGDDETPCPLCARMRRGAIYSVARREGYPVVALGHHGDDLIETLLLNQLFNGRIKAMPPILEADDGVTTVIRPLLLTPEADTRALATAAGLPAFPCQCLGSYRPELKRPEIKKLVATLECDHPGAWSSLLAAATTVDERYLADPRWLPLRDEPGNHAGVRPPAPPGIEKLAGMGLGRGG
jgi:tRNA 2-thiocytidine biosynthesis protein TtcA